MTKTYTFQKFDLSGITDTSVAAKTCYPFQLRKCSLQTVDPILSDNTPMPVRVCAVIRSDGLDLAPNGVGDNYELLQPNEHARYFQPFIDTGMVDLHSGGSAANGSKMWMLGTIKGTETEIMKNDTVKGNLLMATGFIGNLPYTAGTTGTRPVCQNTLAMAVREAGRDHSIRHTTNMRERIEQANVQLQEMIGQFQKSCEMYRAIAKKKITAQQFHVYVRHVFDAPAKPEDTSTKQANILNHVQDLFENQKAYEYVPASRGTMWGGYNAVTQYLTHEYGRNEDSRTNAIFFGESKKMSQRALDLALSMN